MAAYDIHRHFKALRADTGRRRGHSDPFASGFEDELADKAKKTSKAASVEKQTSSSTSTAAHSRTSAAASTRRPASPFVRKAAKDADSEDDDFLTYQPKRPTERRFSPAPPRARPASPAPPRSASPNTTLSLRSPTPKGERESSITAVPRHTVASPFAGTKYLQDSDSDEEAVASRSGSQDSGTGSSPTTSKAEARGKKEEEELLDSLSPFYVPPKKDIKRVDKPKSQGSGISWRAFSEGRAEQRSTEIEALRTNLQKRGKRISFTSHVVTDDGVRIPLGQACADKRGRGRQRSPPRSEQDVIPSTDEVADGADEFDPAQFRTNPFTGQHIKRSNSNPDANPAPNDNSSDERRPSSASGPIPAIRIEHVPHE